MKTLDAHVLGELRRPFTPAAVKFKVQKETKTDPRKGLASFYIDARLAAERLNAVVGPEGWTEEYRVLIDGQLMAAHHFPVECTLTVLGVAKADVGVYQKAQPDSLAWKSAYSDAFKRAAVKFGVGAFLYAGPKVWAPVKVGDNGKTIGFSPEGEKALRSAYTQWLKSSPFGEALDHGDVGDDHDVPADDAPEPARIEPPKDQPSDDQMRELIRQATAHGYPREQISKLLTEEQEAHGGYRKSWWNEQMTFLSQAAA